MLPEKNCGDSVRDSLEQKLPPELFRQILTEIQGSMKLPGRLTWAGQKSESSFADLKMAQGHLNSGFLTSMLQTVGELQKQSGSKDSQISKANNLQTLLKQTSQRHQFIKTSLIGKLRPKPGQMTASLRREVELAEFFKFKRMKTVFCHADHSTDEVSSIFNVQFDRTGRFVISGADDGIIKVWDRDTLTLQASLHGHLDFITDIDISKCNRFIASAGKDAQVIIWDLKMGRVVKRLTSHQSLINRLLFVAPRVPVQQGAAAASAGMPAAETLGSSSTVKAFVMSDEPNTSQLHDTEAALGQQNPGGPVSSYVKDQFLLTCSDDGTVHLYDFSPLSRMVDGANGGAGSHRNAGNSQQHKIDYDEMRVRRSGRRSTNEAQNAISMQNNRDQDETGAAAKNEVYIFEVELTPDDYRPGTRNKKLDAVACSSAGIVVAGTSTGEIFCWKLNFQEISRRNKADSYRYLGQFKICKNAGVQFAEFSPTSDFLMTGSTDGSVKIWRLDIPQAKSMQQSVLKSFSMGDDSRLVVTIDEKNGCIKTNSISYFDEEGLENFEYVPVKQPVSGQVGFSKAIKDLKFSKSQCDAIKWSVRGRFAIASITSQIEDPRNEANAAQVEDFKEEVCRIKIWDTVNETFYDDLARPCGHQLKKNSWVLAPHPIFEELLMTGSDGGTLILWNIERKQIIQRFSQYGVYSIDGYVRDNPLDGKFSCDGKAFIVGNQLGTISLFSCENVEHQYEATRVQQFFQYDRARNSQNPFERIENRPQICGYNMIPHEAQPARPLIGRFPSDQVAQTLPATSQALVKTGANFNQLVQQSQVPLEEESKRGENKRELLDKKMTEAKAFERKMITARELGHLEEKYYQHQLSNCLQDSYQPNVLLEQGNQLDAFVESSIDLPADGGRERVESGYDDQSLVNALSPPRRSGQSMRGNGNQGDQQSPNSQNVIRSRAQASAGPRRSIGMQNNTAINGTRQGGNGRRRLVRRSDRALRDNPVINGYNDSEELAFRDLQAAGSPQSLYQDESEDDDDEDSASDASDLDSSPEVVRQRFQVHRTNMHEQQLARHQQMEEERSNRRTARQARRNEMREPNLHSGTMSGSRRRAARNINNSNDINIDIDQEGDDMPMRRRGRGRPSNAERERLRQFQERQQRHQPSTGTGSARRRILDDDSGSQGTDVAMQDDSGRRQTRTRLRQGSGRTGGDSSQGMSAPYHRRSGGADSDQNQQQINGRGSIRRNSRRAAEVSSNSRSMMDEQYEERKGSPTKAEKTHNQIIRESGYFLSDREEASAFNFDMLQGGANDNDSNEKISKKTMTQVEPPGTQPDEDYNLVEGPEAKSLPPAQKQCSFCQKVDDPLVGPFCKYDCGKLVGSPLYFHQDCIELNQYSKFCIESKKWVNIGKALQNLVHREQFSCFRCQTKGATVQCTNCNKAFHGFKCARMYTLQLGDDHGNTFYQCIFCRNMQNWEDRVSELTEKEVERQELEREGLLHEKQYLKTLQRIEKTHLLSSQGYEKQIVQSPSQSYNPQVNDFVFYFFQGHEYFMTQYSCHFFCGQSQKFARQRFMPWFKNPRIKKREFVRCRVDCVEVLFPSQRSLNLIEMYGGNSTQVTQTPEIIQRITLTVIDSTTGQGNTNSSNSIKFQVDLFPNQLHDFLIPQAVFTEKYESYVKALQSGIQDKTFKVFVKESNQIKTMRIISGNSPLEPTFFANSLWQNIKCVEANPGRSGRVNEMPQHRSSRLRGAGAAVNGLAGDEEQEEVVDYERVSFWDIQYGGADEIQAIAKSMHVFMREEKSKLFNTLKDFIEKKKEYIECFLERVPIEVAPDYRSIIPAEMYFNLIKDRINNCYYRSQEQLLSDIDLISYNAKIYNGEHHDISLNAKELCEIIRVRLKQAMFTKSDTLMQQQIAQVGKLTVPSRTRTALQQKSAIDELRNNLNEDNNKGMGQVSQVIELPTVLGPDEATATGQVQIMINSRGPDADEDQVMAESPREQIQAIPVKTNDHVKPSKAASSVALNQANTATGAVEESKSVNNRAATAQAEEEKKIAGAASSNDIVKINIGSKINTSSITHQSANLNQTSPANIQTSKPDGSIAISAAMESVPAPNNNNASSNNTAAARPTTSSNMSRRRNRINANLLAADELEEKTKTEVSAAATAAVVVQANEQSPAGGSAAPANNANTNNQQRTTTSATAALALAAVAPTTNNESSEKPPQEASAADKQVSGAASTSMRLTRNLRKRQKNE